MTRAGVAAGSTARTRPRTVGSPRRTPRHRRRPAGRARGQRRDGLRAAHPVGARSTRSGRSAQQTAQGDACRRPTTSSGRRSSAPSHSERLPARACRTSITIEVGGGSRGEPREHGAVGVVGQPACGLLDREPSAGRPRRLASHGELAAQVAHGPVLNRLRRRPPTRYSTAASRRPTARPRAGLLADLAHGGRQRLLAGSSLPLGSDQSSYAVAVHDGDLDRQSPSAVRQTHRRRPRGSVALAAAHSPRPASQLRQHRSW